MVSVKTALRAVLRNWPAMLLAAALMGGWHVVHAYEARQFMPLVYSVLVAIHLLVMALIIVRYVANIHRGPLMLPLALFIFVNGASILVLALSTGLNPLFNIVDMRRWVLLSRIVLLAAGVVVVVKGGAFTWRGK